MSPEKKEMQRLVDQALDQLDDSMTVMYAQNASLVTAWMTHELSQVEKTFEECAIYLARNFLIPHDVAYLMNVGKEVDRQMDEHTVGEDA